MHGVLPLIKPKGPTSAACLNALKGLGQKKLGHAGTLDPMADGVLLALLGSGTKLSSHLMAAGHKIYAGELLLGVVTDTWDMEGAVLERNAYEPPANLESLLEREIAAWTLLSEQEVPAYSAAKHEGRPFYKLARQGRPAPRRTKPVKIFSAAMTGLDLSDRARIAVTFRVSCASGAYIRSLAHSLGKRLGCGAALSGLTREYSHPFALAEACPAQELRQNPALLDRYLRPIQDALPDWERVALTPAEACDVRNGKAVRRRSGQPDAPRALLMLGAEAMALAELSADGMRWNIQRGLWN